MTKVLINGLFLSQPKTIGQRYACETLRALDELLASDAVRFGLSFSVVAPTNARSPRLHNIHFVRAGWARGRTWEQLFLPLLARGHFLLNLCPSAPLLCRNQSVTLHDATALSMPGAVPWVSRWWQRWLLPTMARRAAYLMALSDHAKWQFVQYCSADAERIYVSGEGWEHVRRVHSDPALLDQHHLRGQTYLLVIGGLDGQRNLQLVTRVCRRLRTRNLQVVVVGDGDHRGLESLDLSRYRNLRLVGEVSDQQLRALYEHALALVYTPNHHGAESMPLEAMAFHCPVLSARTPLAREVCGDAALYFHPHDPEGLVRLVERMLDQPQVIRELAQRGFRQLRNRSWKAAARQHLQALLEHHGSPTRQAHDPTRRLRRLATPGARVRHAV